MIKRQIENKARMKPIYGMNLAFLIEAPAVKVAVGFRGEPVRFIVPLPVPFATSVTTLAVVVFVLDRAATTP